MTTETTTAPAADAAAPAASPAPAPIGAAAALVAPATEATPPAAAPAPAAQEPSGLKMPGADAKPEEWAAFYRQLGAPEKGDDYKLEVPEGGDPEFAKEAADVFAKTGLRPEQAKALTDWWNSKAAGMTAAQAEAASKAEADRISALDSKNKAEEAQLRNDWGQAHEANMTAARQATKQFFGDKAADVITAIESAVGYGQTMRIMHAIGKGLGEGSELGLVGKPAAASGSGMEGAFKEALSKAGFQS